MANRFDIERVTCEERYGNHGMHGPIVRFRVLKNGSPMPLLFNTFDEAEDYCKEAATWQTENW